MMTYNFDPDRWYENELAYLADQLNSGKLNQAGYEAAVLALNRKYDEMVDRLDGSYQLPK